MDTLIIQGEIHSKILTLRGRQVMLDRDLARLYEVETKVLNQAVKRNIKRFPEDFMFQLSEGEFRIWRSQFVTSKSDRIGLRRAPYAFTEQGIYMLATVLKSDVAIEVNIAIMRTFAKLREFSRHYNALAKQLIEIDRKHDKQYKELKQALDELIISSEVAETRVIGFIQGD